MNYAKLFSEIEEKIKNMENIILHLEEENATLRERLGEPKLISDPENISWDYVYMHCHYAGEENMMRRVCNAMERTHYTSLAFLEGVGGCSANTEC